MTTPCPLVFTTLSTPGNLVLYKMVLKEDYDVIIEQGFLKLNQQSNADWWKIGLREEKDEAVAREVKVYKKEGRGPVNKDTHLICEITFTALGFAYYGMQATGHDYLFQPMLAKQKYPAHEEKDYKVWYFHGDLPLDAKDTAGNVLVQTVWNEIL